MSHQYPRSSTPSVTRSSNDAYTAYQSPGNASMSTVDTWGTDCSDKSKLSYEALSPSQRMFRPVNSPRPAWNSSSWGTVDTSVSSYHSLERGVPSTPASTTLYGGSHMSLWSSTTLVNPSPNDGYASHAAHSPFECPRSLPPPPTVYAIQIHPDLKPGSRTLRVDFNYYQGTSDAYASPSALMPSVSYMEIRFPGFSNVSCRIHRMDGSPVTINTILDHVYRFLQACYQPSAQYELQSTRPSSAQGRHIHLSTSNRALRWIDLLCEKGTTRFGGLTPTAGDNIWNIHFTA